MLLLSLGGILFELIRYFFCICLRLIRLVFPKFLSKYQDKITSSANDNL